MYVLCGDSFLLPHGLSGLIGKCFTFWAVSLPRGLFLWCLIDQAQRHQYLLILFPPSSMLLPWLLGQVEEVREDAPGWCSHCLNVFLKQCKPSTASPFSPLTPTVKFNLLRKMQGMACIILRMSAFTHRLFNHAFSFSFGEVQLIVCNFCVKGFTQKVDFQYSCDSCSCPIKRRKCLF